MNTIIMSLKYIPQLAHYLNFLFHENSADDILVI